MFPVAAEAAERQGESLASMSFLVMLAASASFMSPFGYQTNLMVYGPGGRLQGLFALWRADAGADGGQRRGDRAGRQVLVRELGRDGTGVRRDVRADDDDAGERAQRLCRFFRRLLGKTTAETRAKKTRTRVGGAALVALARLTIRFILSVIYCASKRSFVRWY